MKYLARIFSAEILPEGKDFETGSIPPGYVLAPSRAIRLKHICLLPETDDKVLYELNEALQEGYVITELPNGARYA